MFIDHTFHLVIIHTKWRQGGKTGTGKEVQDSRRQRHGGLHVVLHVAHLQTLEGEDGRHAADGPQDDPHDHQGPDRLEQRWGQRATPRG